MSYPFDQSGFPYGVSQPGLDLDLIESYVGADSNSFHDSGGSTPIGIYLVRFAVSRPITVNTISVAVTSDAGNFDGGIYEDTGSTRSLVASSGSTAVADPGSDPAVLQNLALTVDANLTPGTNYYMAIAASDNSVQYVGRNSYAAILGLHARVLYKASTFPLPASLTGEATADFLPWIVARNV